VFRKLFGICWHKWKYVYRTKYKEFLDETYDKLVKKFRICEKCGEAQKLHEDSIWNWWETLNQAETEILKRKIIDKGDYYILENKED